MKCFPGKDRALFSLKGLTKARISCKIKGANMNKIGLNICLVLLLSGCNMFTPNNRTDSKGERINSNAPMFVTPNTNANPVNKPNTNPVTPNKPAQVSFNAENYVMVKEKDLNILVNQKTNEALLNIKNSNANAKQPNKELDAAIDSHIKKIVEPTSVDLTPKIVQLAPVVEPEKPSNAPALHPVFAFILTTLAILGFILTVGYFFFIKKKVQNEAPTQTQESPKVATETATENPANKTPEAKAD